jgi:hypothetical protein
LKLTGKVSDSLSLLQDAYSFADLFIFVYIALTAKLEATENALANERAARLIVDRSLVGERAARLATDQSLRSS